MSAVAENPLPAGFDVEAAVSGVRWLDSLRAEALQSFHAGGIPHRRIEEWKYSDLRTALDAPRALTTALRSSIDPFAGIAGPRLLIRDGRFDTAHSDRNMPESVALLDLGRLGENAPAWVQTHFGKVLKGAMGQASIALMKGGVALRISGEHVLPLHLRFEQREEAVHARVMIVVEQGAALTLLESHAQGVGLTDIGVEFVLAPGARLTHVRLADAAAEAIRIEEIGVRVGRDAIYRGHFAQTGTKLERIELTISLDAEGAQAELSGAGVLAGKRHSDITTHVTHAAGKTTSRQLFKYAASDHSRAVYQGRITVAKGADGSDSRQTAKAILLGERAEADLKPELEILADDVKCAHGAAVGDLDTDSLFYLRARGIPESEARTLLLRAFLEEAVADMADDSVRGAVWRFVDSGLSSGTEASQ